ncbi:permease [Gemmatirosa kalamazoonensis]|uniref:Permease n=1 Tax=Gemmatirosa kalamazoonensis TaxID=861299 RepID=W0REA5_9BACT|nr:ABC transporter permease [Gemmatirosa kalamazoonensis]AHG88665.1 permease [Gemmatirosa kalamazoonensis]
MSPRRFRRLFRLPRTGARRARDEMDEEIRFHLEARAARLAERGFSPEAATAEARRRFAGDAAARDDGELLARRRALADSAVRREDRMHRHDLLETLSRDLRQALRGLRRAPGFTLAVAVTLALGIGANTAVFSVVRAVLLRPLPYADPAHLVVVWNHWPESPRTWLSQPEAYDYAAHRTTFERFAAFSDNAMNVTGGCAPEVVGCEAERVRVGVAEASLLDVLGVRPLLGRNFTRDEDVPNGARVALLHEDFWRRRYGADPRIVGRTIRLDATPVTVVGVLPSAFRLPLEFAGDHAQLLLPLRLGPPDENERGAHRLNAVAKLPPGLTPAAAQRRVDAFMADLRREHEHDYGPNFGVTLVPVAEQVRGDVRPLLLVLVGAVSFVLLVGCANVANLLVARAERRGREVAVRRALGAGRGRLAAQVLMESVVLALGGGALGLLLAAWATRALAAAPLPQLPRLDRVAVDGPVLAYTLAVSLVTGLLFGLAPVARLGAPNDPLRQGRGTTVGRPRARLRQLLVAGQLALAAVSLTGAALMTRSFARLTAVSPGFAPEHVLTLRLSPPAAKYGSSSAVRAFYAALLERVRALPGVRSAGAVSALPFDGSIGDWGFSIEGVARPRSHRQPGPAADFQAATPGYIEAMRIPLLRGRTLTDADRLGAPAVVVASESMARRWFPGGDALGRRIQLLGGADSVWRTVVGIVGDVRHGGLAEPAHATMYVPHAQAIASLPDSIGAVPRSLSVVIRAVGDEESLGSAVRALVRRLDPDVPAARVRPLAAVVSDSLATSRLATLLLLAFGALALVLCAVGVYGVMSYVVAQRVNEIGIRIALGAPRGAVMRRVMWQGMRPVLVGLAAGAALAWAGTRLMRGVLFQVSATDPASYAAALLALVAVAALANWRPARRAAKVDPIVALRAE